MAIHKIFSKLYGFVLALFLMIPSISNSAEITVEGSPIPGFEDNCNFRMSAEIFSSSLPQLAKKELDRCMYTLHINGFLDSEVPIIINSLQIAQRKLFLGGLSKASPPLWVSLESEGGDVMAAIETGRLLKTGWHSPTNTRVNPGHSCISACVFLLAAGKNRESAGTIGIHRPRFTEINAESLDANSLKRSYENLYLLINDYLNYNNIHPDFLDDMWTVPSNKIVILSRSQLERYRLLGKDLIYAEMENLELIKSCGENAPQLRDDFWEQHRKECSEHEGLECLHGLVKSHPYGDCLSKTK
tara:strand:- start:484 stop:1386 length:903 start_codon:yes stop_codon:yes gene_type:complete